MKPKIILILIAFCGMILIHFNALAELQLPEEPVKNMQTFTGCIKVWEVGVPPTAANLRIITAPLQSCNEDEIKIQFQANRLSDLEPVGRIGIESLPGRDVIYHFSHTIINNAGLNTRTASGTTPTSIEHGPVAIWCDPLSLASQDLNDGFSSGSKFGRIELDEMGIPGYGYNGVFPKLKVTLIGAKVIGIKKVYGETQREEIQLSYDRMKWLLSWFDMTGGLNHPEFYCEFDTRTEIVDGDDFGGYVTAYKETPSVYRYPDEFLFRYLEQDSINLSSTDRTEEFFSLQKAVDPATIANLFALFEGQLLDSFNIDISEETIQYRKVAVKSVEIRFDSKSSVTENVTYQGERIY